MNNAHTLSSGWNAAALAAFAEGTKDGLHPDDIGGKAVQSFARSLKHVDSTRLPQDQTKRSEVFSLVKDASIDTATVSAAIMAWGGMNQRYIPKFFDTAKDGWLEVADDIRKGDLDRGAAYARFAGLRDESNIYGVGPAYFTKLIYFLTPRPSEGYPNAYIMDQWAGCSINLLVDDELVKMDVTRTWKTRAKKAGSSFRVSDVNTAVEYEDFCSKVDALRAHFDLSPDQVDRQMIATGGKKKSSWRNYVIENRSI
jgi:hypothetical protein